MSLALVGKLDGTAGEIADGDDGRNGFEQDECVAFHLQLHGDLGADTRGHSQKGCKKCEDDQLAHKRTLARGRGTEQGKCLGLSKITQCG